MRDADWDNVREIGSRAGQSMEQPPHEVWGAEPDWGQYDDDGRYDSYQGYGRDLGELTRITVFKDRVLDVERRPVEGSGHEREAISLGAGERVVPASPPPPPPLPQPPPHEQQLVWLERIAGGADQLADLDDDPLQPEEGELDLSPLTWDLETRLRRILERIDEFAPTLIGPEGAIVARRLAGRAVLAQPRLLGAREKDGITVGQVIHAAGKGNDLVGPHKLVLVKEIQAVTGLTSSPAQRSRAFADAVSGEGLEWPRHLRYTAGPEVYVLGSPDLLVSAFRRQLIRTRDHALRLRAVTPAATA